MKKAYVQLLEITSRVAGQAKKFSHEIAKRVKRGNRSVMHKAKSQLDEMIPRVQQVLRACIQRLPRFKTPSFVRFVANLPRTPNGKLHRPTLLDWFAQSTEPPASKPLSTASPNPSARPVS